MWSKSVSSISNPSGQSFYPFPSSLCTRVEMRTPWSPVSRTTKWDSDLGNFHRRCRWRQWCSTRAHCRAWGKPLRCTRGQLPSSASPFLRPSGSSETGLHWKSHREQKGSRRLLFSTATSSIQPLGMGAISKKRASQTSPRSIRLVEVSGVPLTF